ncbi:MAG: class I SAM-dependent methyltransferase [Alphaproteobacteria bacterium]|nr:class I SAM-dependent methyltransferase [Alphaproteobacteria bacterium]
MEPVALEIRQQLMAQAQGSMRLTLAYIGVTNQLFPALQAGPLDVAGLAAAADVDLRYTERWTDAAAAFGLIERTAAGFALTELGAAFLPDRPGSQFGTALMAVLSTHVGQRAAALMPSGDVAGEGVLGEITTLGPWFGPMLETNFGAFFEEQILPAVPALAEIGARGGLAVDLGCGNGWYLRRLAARFPKLRGVGLDMVPDNIAGARARAEAAGLAGRLDFHQGDIHHFSVDEPADLVVMNRALHHVWADGPDRIARILRDHLAEDGVVAIWEPRWPDDPAILGGSPKLRGLSFMHLNEHVQGNHLLTPALIQDAFAAVDMDSEVFLFADDTEMVVVARR